MFGVCSQSNFLTLVLASPVTNFHEKPRIYHSQRAPPNSVDRLPDEEPGPQISNILSSLNSFEDACGDLNLEIKPKILKFLPEDAWLSDDIRFGVLVSSFFQKRNFMHCRFAFKLCNALLLTVAIPEIFRFIGVRWVTNDILLVNGPIFAKLLGVKTVDGSLFHLRGNFPSHGFVELAFPDAQQIARENGMEDIDSSTVRLMTHQLGGFTRENQRNEVGNLKWIRS
jgi:hypothetical protein